MKTEIVRITPQIATKMLMANKNMRAISRTAVDNLKEAWARGEYVTSHQGIAFVGGDLVDGQHRLTAVSEMPPNFSIEMLVCRNVDERAVKVMDLGRKRSAAEILGEDRRVVEAARFLAAIYVAKANAITPQYLERFVESIRAPHEDLLRFCPAACKMWSSAPVRAAFVVVSLADGDTDYAKLVYRSLVQQDFNTMPRSAQAVFRAHIAGKVRAAQSSDAFVRMLKIFNPANAQLAKIQIQDTAPALELVRSVLRKVVFGTDPTKAPFKAPGAFPAPRVPGHGHGGYLLARI